MPRLLLAVWGAVLASCAGCTLILPSSQRTADFDAGSQDPGDAPYDATRIDGGVDASTGDAPALDAPDANALDAPMLDAPTIDAPMLDAPMLDAPCTRVMGYLDGDRDGHGAGASMEGCAESGLVLDDDDTDCDDGDPTVHPGIVDTDCDGVDADCDRVADVDDARVNAACTWGVCAPLGCDLPVELEAGHYHTCTRLEQSGELFCWGRNDGGEFGPGSPAGPTSVPFDTGFTALDHCTTSNATCLITGTTIRCLGTVAAGFPADFVETAVGWTPVEIACGDDEFCVRGSDGSVRCAGSNTGGQSGSTPSGAPLTSLSLVSVPSASQITVGANHACALISGGAVACWGANDAGQLGRGTTTPATDPVGAVIDASIVFASVEAMNFATCARTTTGAVYCWGPTFEHQVLDRSAGASVLTPTVSTSSLFASLHGGPAVHACGLTSTGEIRCWGIGLSLALGRANASSSIPAAAMPGRSILASDLAVASAGALAHTCAIERDTGRVYCWGANDFGQCGGTISSTPLASAVEVLP